MSHESIGLLLEVLQALRSVKVDLREVFVREVVLLDGPLGESVIEGIEADSLIGVDLRPELLNIESFDQLAVHKQEQVQGRDVRGDVALAEVGVELLQGEVLEDLGALRLEEATDFLDSGELLEKVSVLKLGAVLRVVSHQVLSQEDARVESLADARVNFICAIVKTRSANWKTVRYCLAYPVCPC